MSGHEISQLHLRRIQGETLFGVYKVLKLEMGEQAALSVIRRTVEENATLEGQKFARSAPNGPSLAHFATVLDRWRNSGALEIQDIQTSDNELSFVVTRCEYAESYRLMGIPPALAYVLSCSRDATFARGYMPSLVLDRSATIVQGGPACEFRFLLPE